MRFSAKQAVVAVQYAKRTRTVYMARGSARTYIKPDTADSSSVGHAHQGASASGGLDSSSLGHAQQGASFPSTELPTLPALINDEADVTMAPPPAALAPSMEALTIEVLPPPPLPTPEILGRRLTYTVVPPLFHNREPAFPQ